MGMICTTPSTDAGGMRESIPQWVYNVWLDPSKAGDTFGRTSDGLQIISQNCVERHRSGHFHTDGAQWGRGFVKGRHVFEIIYPEHMRHTEATIGVGTNKASVSEKGRCSLVGSTSQSWGIDLRTKRALHKGLVVKKYPVTQLSIPDKFYMYLDCEAGNLSFGSDVEYYGTAICNLTSGEELFPMVSSCIAGASITMIYRGEGFFGATAPGPTYAYGIPPTVIVQTTTVNPAPVQTTTNEHHDPPPEYSPKSPEPTAPTQEVSTEESKTPVEEMKTTEEPEQEKEA